MNIPEIREIEGHKSLRPAAKDGLIDRRCHSDPGDPEVDLESVRGRSSSGTGIHGDDKVPSKVRLGSKVEPGRPDPVKLLLSPAEAAWALGIGRTTLYQLLGTGAIDSVCIGSLRRIPVASLQTYVDTLATANRTVPAEG